MRHFVIAILGSVFLSASAVAGNDNYDTLIQKIETALVSPSPSDLVDALDSFYKLQRACFAKFGFDGSKCGGDVEPAKSLWDRYNARRVEFAATLPSCTNHLPEIGSRKVYIGMELPCLYLALGKPDNVSYFQDASGKQTAWTYGTRRVVYIQNDKVVAEEMR